MNTRQPRYDVTISALVRSGLAVSSACIMNASLRGLMLFAVVPPLVGSYVELEAQRHVMVGRVVWAGEHRFGVQTQDDVPVALVPDLGRSAAPIEAKAFRAATSTSSTFDRSRSISSALQFALVVMFSAATASLAYEAVEASLSVPLAMAEAVLRAPARQ